MPRRSEHEKMNDQLYEDGFISDPEFADLISEGMDSGVPEFGGVHREADLCHELPFWQEQFRGAPRRTRKDVENTVLAHEALDNSRSQDPYKSYEYHKRKGTFRK